jgi:hypothetical protein
MEDTSFDDMSYSQGLSSQDFPGSLPFRSGSNSGSTGNVIRPNNTCLPFNPGPEFQISPERLEVDPFLYRLFDRRSEGYTDGKWAKSRDAHAGMHYFDVDVFARSDRARVAQALKRHFWWQGQTREEDNYVSYTNSLMYVLQYGFFRKARFSNHDFEHMGLCVVDTRRLPKGAFIRDMVLIDTFSQHEPCPSNERSLTSLRRIRKDSKYYFGEYLSQGALQIEGCCAIVSMREIVNCGLYDLRPEFKLSAKAQEPKWAKDVIKLRELFSKGPEHYVLATDRELDAAWRIGNRFGPTWQVCIALAFLALKPRHDADVKILRKFGPLCSSG